MGKFSDATVIVASSDVPLSLGELQAGILAVVQRLSKASARDVKNGMEGKRPVPNTTGGTVLDRLYRKGLLKERR